MIRDTDILIGKRDDKYLVLRGTEHVAVQARTGMGKTRNFAVPNAFAWKNSLVVFDLKREIYQVTAGHRAYRLGQKVYCFDPTDLDRRTHCWNPLDVVDRNADTRFEQIRQQAFLLVPEMQGHGGRANDEFWLNAGRMALYSVTAMLAEMPGQKFTYGNVLAKFIRGDGAQWLVDRIDERRQAGNPFSQPVVSGVSDYIGLRDQLHEDIRKSVSTALQAFQTPEADAATSYSHFDLRTLRREPQTIYVTINPAALPRTKALLRLFFSSVLNSNLDVTPDQDPTLEYSILMLLDEFPQLGVMKDLTSASRFARGYGIRIAYILQDKKALEDIYGPAATADVFDNLGAEVIFGIGDIRAAKEYEERLGDYTMLFTTQNAARFFPWLNWQRQTTATHPHRRPLVLDQELVMMPPWKQYIVRTGMKPAQSERIVWDQDAKFTKLVIPPPDVPVMSVHVPDDDGSITLPIGRRPTGRGPNPSPANPRRGAPRSPAPSPPPSPGQVFPGGASQPSPAPPAASPAGPPVPASVPP